MVERRGMMKMVVYVVPDTDREIRKHRMSDDGVGIDWLLGEVVDTDSRDTNG